MRPDRKQTIKRRRKTVKKQLLQLFDEEYGIEEKKISYPQRSKSYQAGKAKTLD